MIRIVYIDNKEDNSAFLKIQTDFIGLRIKFADPENAEPCLDASQYMFEMLVWDDPGLALVR